MTISLINGTRPEELAGSLLRVWVTGLEQLGYAWQDRYDEAEQLKGWWGWVTDFVGRVQGQEEVTITVSAEVRAATTSYALALALPVDHELLLPKYQRAFEAVVRHLAAVLGEDERVGLEEFHDLEASWPAWIRSTQRGADELQHANG